LLQLTFSKTLINVEVIDELVIILLLVIVVCSRDSLQADISGVGDQVKAITESAMRGICAFWLWCSWHMIVSSFFSMLVAQCVLQEI
jgi:hypothetical protein